MVWGCRLAVFFAQLYLPGRRCLLCYSLLQKNPGKIQRFRPEMTAFKKLYLKSRHLILYGVLLAILIFALKCLQWKFLITDNALDIYVGLIAIFFTILGIWVATQLVKPKVEKVVVEKEIYIPQPGLFMLNEAELKKLNLSSREYEVLQLLAKGYSNADIAKSLFLSLSTVKTHVSNLFLKMDVKSRTQTIEKAKRLRIIE
jgi:NarL family two-component system response regulator LiaR